MCIMAVWETPQQARVSEKRLLIATRGQLTKVVKSIARRREYDTLVQQARRSNYRPCGAKLDQWAKMEWKLCLSMPTNGQGYHLIITRRSPSVAPLKGSQSLKQLRALCPPHSARSELVGH